MAKKATDPKSETAKREIRDRKAHPKDGGIRGESEKDVCPSGKRNPCFQQVCA